MKARQQEARFPGGSEQPGFAGVVALLVQGWGSWEAGQGSEQEATCGGQSRKQGSLPRAPQTPAVGQEGHIVLPRALQTGQMLLLCATAVPSISPLHLWSPTQDTAPLCPQPWYRP